MWAGALAAGAVAIGVAATRVDEGPEVDRELFELLNRGHGETADRWFSAVTELGSLYASGAAAAVLVATGRRRAAASAFAAATTTWLLGQGLKRLTVRPRPYTATPLGTRRLIAEPKGTSWPSSHPAVLTTFSRVAARELGVGALARTALAGADLSVAASRVYLGVHYPSDVASGLLFGRAVARVWPGRR
jgi:membrane-associated phospholipid phosphatase